jgi:hypothetical protein
MTEKRKFLWFPLGEQMNRKCSYLIFGLPLEKNAEIFLRVLPCRFL